MPNEHKKILILGSTGSIGASACSCVRRFRGRFSVAGLAAGANVDLLISQIREFSPSSIYITDPKNSAVIKSLFGKSVTVYDGGDNGSGNGNDRGDASSGLERIVNETDYDILLNALVGAVGFRPTVAALRRGKRVALANKESLVIGGDYISTIINNGNNDGNDGDGNGNGGTRPLWFNGRLLPVDSEHSAILQCLPRDGAADTVESIILTASGGPFRRLPKEALASVTPEQALSHPTWSMGKKITVDSATLMNKGFEVIEARHLFSLPYSKLRVCVHPQSIVHSLVEFHDGAALAQLGLPDMELPIQYALSWPERLPAGGRRLSLPEVGALEFFEPDAERFPCLKLCVDAGIAGGTAPAAANAANEVAVGLFLSGRVGFTRIAEIVADALDKHDARAADSVEAIEEADRETRRMVVEKYQ